MLFSSTVIGQKLLFTQEQLMNPRPYSELFDRSFEAIEVNHIIPDSTQYTILENGYASAILTNSNQVNIPLNHTVDTIDVVFSLYPQNPEFWITNYHVLLARRLTELFKWDNRLNDASIHWRLVLQTDCQSEPEAIGLFHGFVVHHHEEKELTIKMERAPKKEEPLFSLPPLPPDTLIQSLVQYIQDKGGFEDYSVYQILDRNAANWDSTLVVIDWTGSMYHHGAQAILYHLLEERKLGIQQFVFFNDGDGKKDERKKLGNTGGLYALSPHQEDLEQEALDLFFKVEEKGNGGDREENDIEALIWAIRNYSDFKNLVLIADNAACIRDFTLYKSLNIPIHIILPGTIHSINHQYINLAYATKGSVHTLTADVLDFQEGRTPEMITCLDDTYILNPFGWYQNIEPMPSKFCNIYYGVERYGFQTRKWLRSQLQQ